MDKTIFSLIIISVFIFSCREGTNKTDQKTEQHSSARTAAGQNAGLIYLDTAENMYNILCQSWVMADDAEGLEGMTETSKFEIPYRSFYFSTKGSFVKNPRNTFDYGTWSFDEAAKTITINNVIDKEKNIYKIASIAYNELILVNTGINSTTNLKFISPGLRFKNANDEPFFIDNNRWRIKPKQKEPDSAIHQRLKENLHFFILFYKDVLAKDEKTVSFWGLPSCFKWYGGAVFIKKEGELKENWVDCFYNKEQAMKAYTLAEKLMEKKYDWPKGEPNWIKQNLFVLEQMYKKMDEVK